MINGLVPTDQTLYQLRALLGARKGTSLVHAFAPALGSTVDGYIAEHSTLGYTRAIAKRPDIPHARFGRKVFQTLREGVAVCPDCVNDDEIAYIRREHQMPGLDWCVTHERALCTADEERIGRPVKQWVLNTVPITVADEEYSHPVILQFGIVTRFFAAMSAPLPTRRVSGELARRMKEKGIDPPGGGPRTLSVVARQSAPKNWLYRLFPELSGSDSFSGVDCVGRSAYACRTAAYALAFAMMYEDVGSVLARLTRDTPDAPRQIKTLGTLANKYVEARRSALTEYISNQGCIHDGRRRTKLEVAFYDGLPGLHHLPRPEWIALRRFFKGEQLSHACEREGADIARVEEYLRRSGHRFGLALSRMAPPALSEKAAKRIKSTS